MGIKLVSVILKQVFFILAKQQDILIVKTHSCEWRSYLGCFRLKQHSAFLQLIYQGLFTANFWSTSWLRSLLCVHNDKIYGRCPHNHSCFLSVWLSFSYDLHAVWFACRLVCLLCGHLHFIWLVTVVAKFAFLFLVWNHDKYGNKPYYLKDAWALK